MRYNESLLDIKLLWEIPCAFLSFIFFKTVRICIRTLANISTSINKKTTSKWLVYSEEMLKKPLILPSILVTGPRWNPHTIAAGAGPFDIKESLAIDIKSCLNSAQSWTIGIYSFPDAKPIQHIASHSSNFQEQWHQLKLNPGKYTLGLRYYHWFDKVDLPAINADNHKIIDTQSINSQNVNNYFHKLIERDNIFYRCLNSYIFTLLICEEWLPKEFVRKEYLPVGDTNNEFLYGVIYKNCSLNLQINSLVINNYDVYLTIYNCSSLPVIWYQVKEEKHITPTVEKDGFYLIRLRPKIDCSDNSLQPSWVTVKLLPHEASSYTKSDELEAPK